MARDMQRSPMSELSDDLLIEIISRMPYKSNCRCKCVSRRWRDLISHPDHRKKLPRSTLAGFFYEINDSNRHPHVVNHGYQSVSGDLCLHVDTSLSFLPKCQILGIYLLHCCNGLLLSQRWDSKSYHQQVLDYVVCNPATEKWLSVPTTEWSSDALGARLGFDPAISSHFHLFEFSTTTDETGKSAHIKVVRIYSSKAGAWTHRSPSWGRPIELRSYSASAFFNGAMYLASYADMVVAVVDVEGNCRVIPIPTSDGSAESGVYLSQGKLYLARYDAYELSVWALEDSTSGENWTLKHNVSHLQLFGQKHSSYPWVCSVFIHPEENVIFIMCMGSYTGGPRSAMKLMSYDMDSRELRPIHDLELGAVTPFLEYVPFFSGSLADEN